MSPGKWLMDKKDALILESLSASTAVMTVIAENFGSHRLLISPPIAKKDSMILRMIYIRN
jgi:hypothetical protein